MSTTTQNGSVQPYLFFDGRCEEAANFYRAKLGAEVTMQMRFKDSPDQQNCGPNPPPGDKIMHMNLRIGDTTILASDGRCQAKANFQGFALSLTVDSVAEADKYFAALSEGGQVQMPIGKTFFSPRFGMLSDKFGVNWMVYVKPAA